MQLSAEQQAVLNHGEGPAMVVACPGSGKTTVVTHRLARLVAAGVPEPDILCITFTRNAANEMRERAERLLGHRPACVIKTFHSLAAYWLRQDISMIDTLYRKGFSIMDESDAKQLISKCMKLHLETKYLGEKVSSKIKEDEFGELDTPGKLLEAFQAHNEGLKPQVFSDGQRAVYDNYQNEKIEQNVMDFADVITLGTRLLQQERYSKIHKWLMVDEFQDSNRLNLDLTLSLGRHGNVMVVGDPDQSIYGFRHAIPAVFEDFQDKTDAQLYTLSQTRRFGRAVAVAASYLASSLPGAQMRKPIVTHNASKSTIQHLRFSHHEHEARYIARIAGAFCGQAGTSARPHQ